MQESRRFYAAGRYDSAKRRLRQAIQVAESRKVGAEETAETLTALSNLLVHTGHPKDAEPLARRALAMQEDFNGKQSFEAAMANADLAEVEDALDDSASAEKALRAALEDAKEKFPGHELAEADVKTQLGLVLIKLKQYAAADETISEAIGLLQFYGKKPDPASGLRALADLRLAQGRSLEAFALARHAADLAKQKGNLSPAQEWPYWDTLAECAFAAGSYQESTAAFTRELQIRKRFFASSADNKRIEARLAESQKWQSMAPVLAK